jgi:hypothetical protein
LLPQQKENISVVGKDKNYICYLLRKMKISSVLGSKLYMLLLQQNENISVASKVQSWAFSAII